MTFEAEEGLLPASEDSPQPPLPVPPRPRRPCETVQGLSAFHSIPQKKEEGVPVCLTFSCSLLPSGSKLTFPASFVC